MTKDFIPETGPAASLVEELQPLFCSRASLLQAQDKLTNNPDMDCQMRLRFPDGSEVALKIKRADIENIITEHISTIETSIHNTLDEIVTEETTPTI
jgi:hypothetical protein